MQIVVSITILIVLLLVAVLSAPLAKRIGLPFSALLVIEGFLGSELIVALGFDLGLRWYHFHDLVFFILLPVALALSIPLELEYWYTVQSIAYGVVLFTLFVQAPTIPFVMKKVGVK